MTKKYKYTKIENSFRPIIPVTLRHFYIQFQYMALIDSGSDFCIFHADIAAILGIDYRQLSRKDFSGIGSGMKCSGYVAMIEGGLDNVFFEMPVIFSPDISDYGYGVVGQIGFFDKLKITFNFDTKDILIKF